MRIQRIALYDIIRNMTSYLGLGEVLDGARARVRSDAEGRLRPDAPLGHLDALSKVGVDTLYTVNRVIRKGRRKRKANKAACGWMPHSASWMPCQRRG